MKTKLIILLSVIVSFIAFISCGDNEYEFIGSRQGELFLYDPTLTVDDMVNGRKGSQSIFVAVDVYRKKTDNGFTYKVKSQEGNEYKLWESTMLSPYTHSAANFRYKNLVGTIHLQL